MARSTAPCALGEPYEVGRRPTLTRRLHRLTDTAAVVRDTVYMDGGDLFWTPGYSDGSFQTPIVDGSQTLDTFAIVFCP